MITTTILYHIDTGNLYGVSLGWLDAFEKVLDEIDIQDLDESNVIVNPAFAGCQAIVKTELAKNHISRRWKQLLPLALCSMSEQCRVDYDNVN